MALRVNDLRELLEVAVVAGCCRTMADVAEHLMPEVARLCRADMTIYHQINLETMVEFNVVWPAPLFSLERVAEYAHVQAQHPFVQHFRDVDERGAVRLSDLVPRRSWRSSAVYGGCLRALGVDDQMTVILGVRDGCRHGLSVARHGRAFSDRERDLFSLVRPHARTALRAALTCGTPYSAVHVDVAPVVVTVSGEALPPSVGLTPREREVLALLAQGLTSGQAGRRLGISARTVDKHVEHLHAKLGASCRLEAVERARELLRPDW